MEEREGGLNNREDGWNSREVREEGSDDKDDTTVEIIGLRGKRVGITWERGKRVGIVVRRRKNEG